MEAIFAEIRKQTISFNAGDEDVSLTSLSPLSRHNAVLIGVADMAQALRASVSSIPSSRDPSSKRRNLRGRGKKQARCLRPPIYHKEQDRPDVRPRRRFLLGRQGLE